MTLPAEANDRSTTEESRSADRLLSTELGTDVGFLLARMSAWVSSYANRSLIQFELNVRSYSILTLSCGDPAPTQRECADFLSLDPSRVVALVDELELRRLVQRIPSSRDRRMKSVQATDAGRKLFTAARMATKAAEGEALKHVTPTEVERLRMDLQTAAAFQENKCNMQSL